MTKAWTGLMLILVFCLTLTVLTGGGWAETDTNNSLEQRFDYTMAVESITGPNSFVFGGQDETYLKIHIADDGRIGVDYAGKIEDSAKAFFDYLQSNFNFDCPSDAQILDVLRIALRYIDPSAKWVTSSTLEYCDDLCQAERAVLMIKNKREFVNRLNLLIHKLSGGIKK